jgi:hypothetical protein
MRCDRLTTSALAEAQVAQVRRTARTQSATPSSAAIAIGLDALERHVELGRHQIVLGGEPD